MLRHGLLALSFSIVLTACPGPQTHGDASDVNNDAVDGADVSAPRNPALLARFNVTSGQTPAPFEIPFPSDLYLDATGHVVPMLDDYSAGHLFRATDTFSTGLEGLDGFGLSTGAMFPIDSVTVHDGDPAFVVDPATLPATPEASLMATASAFIVDLDPTLSPAAARIPCGAGWQFRFGIVTVIPERTVLTPGHHYAVVLTDGIKSVGANVSLTAPPIFAAIRDNAPGARSGAIGMLYGNAVDRVVQIMGTGFDRSHIAGVAVFTAQTTTRQLRIARDAIVGGAIPTPTLSTDATVSAPFHVARFGAQTHAGWNATLDAWLGTALQHNGTDVPGFPTAGETPNGLAHDQIGAVLTGTFVAPDYRGPDGKIAFDAAGAPIAVNATNRIPMTLAIPRGPVPANGFPVVIFGHGLGGQRREMLGIANEMARAGIATAAIDHVTFGQRGTPVDTTTIEHGTYTGPDGLGDTESYPVNDFFGGLTNIAAFRDNIRQTVLDLAQFRRLLASPTLDLSFVADEYGGTAPRLDGAHIAYVGNSLGGIIGTVFAGSDPDVNPVVLNVAGGTFLTRLAADAPAEGALIGQVAHIIFGAPSDAPLDHFHPVSNIIQMIVDGADPATYAAAITHPATGRPHDVWLVEALWDDTVANSSTDILAEIMGLPQIRPVANPLPGLDAIDSPVSGNLAMGATGAFAQLSPASHGADLDNRYGERRYLPPFPTSDNANRFPMVPSPYRIREPIVAYQHRIADFFTSAFTTGHASISNTGIEALIDYDDDGWTDDEERAMSSNPYDPSSHPAGTPPHVRDVGF